MADLGTATIAIALALTLYGVVGTLMGVRLQVRAAIQSAKYSGYVVSLALGMACATLVSAFLNNDFSIRYVAEHSNLAMPRIYTWVAFYAGNEGSLLFVTFALSAMAMLLVKTAPERLGSHLAYTQFVLMIIIAFFLSVMLFLANPFTEMAIVPNDGKGINPLLTHPGMFIHPPMIMTGLISVALPFSLAMGGLLSNRIDDDWVDIGRIWGIIAWAVLATGLLLGAWWAYTILGWGGYWAWDPVENAALMPWLGLTAFIHSIMVQKRRGMFRMWNIALLNITFCLACFGIFINRGGPVPSVHSFGASTLGWVFLLFLGVTIIASFGVFFYRMSSLRSSQNLESVLSRESAFLVNNLLLLGIAFITLWGVVFPLLSELIVDRTITVGEPFYNKVNGPLLIVLIFVMGVGPLMPWRRSTWPTIRKNLVAPIVLTVIVIIAIVSIGVRIPVAVIAFGVSSLAAFSVLQELIRGTVARHRSSGSSLPIAFVQLIAANRPRYGGYVVHIAIVLLAFGIVGSSFYNLERDVIMGIGDRSEIGDYEVEFSGMETRNFSDRTERKASINIYRDERFVSTIQAWQGLYPSFQMLSTRAAIRSTPKEDVYVLFSELQPDGTRAAFRLLLNPLVWWMWVSGPLLIAGTIIALWPSRHEGMLQNSTRVDPPK